MIDFTLNATDTSTLDVQNMLNALPVFIINNYETIQSKLESIRIIVSAVYNNSTASNLPEITNLCCQTPAPTSPPSLHPTSVLLILMKPLLILSISS